MMVTNNKEYSREYYKKNKEKLKIYQKEYAEKNKERDRGKISEYQKEYKKEYIKKIKINSMLIAENTIKGSTLKIRSFIKKEGPRRRRLDVKLERKSA